MFSLGSVLTFVFSFENRPKSTNITNMKLTFITLMFLAPCVVWAAAPDNAEANDAVTVGDGNAKTKKEDKPNVTKTNITGNFNGDRTEAWGDLELVGGGQVCDKNI